MKKTLIAMTLLLAGLSTNANAEFVTGDYLSEGDSNVTLDSTTGLEWLGLSLTNKKSVNDVKLLINSGGYAGFRLATQDEVSFMFDQFLSASKDSWLENGRSDFSELLGGVIYSNAFFSYGLVEDSSGSVTLYGTRMVPGESLYRDYVSSYNEDYSHNAYGIYLVSDSGASYSAINDSSYNATRLENAASVPAPFLLGGLGLLGLAGARRRSAK